MNHRRTQGHAAWRAAAAATWAVWRRRATAAMATAALALSLGGLGGLAGCGLLPSSAPPQPIDSDAGAPLARTRLTALIATEEPVKGAVSLYEAMARAVKYNLDHKIERMAEALRDQQLAVSRFELLPSVVASSGFSGRSSQAGSRSRSLATGAQSLEPSTSSEQFGATADLGASWDLLDFGLGWVRSQQAGDEKLIAVENRRKVVNRILEDVRTAYWRAVSADRTFKKLVDLETLARRALRQAEDLESRRIVAPLTVLNYQRDLLQVQGDVQKLQRELSLAKSQLAALINLPPDTNFPLQLPDRSNVVPELPGSADEMVLTGLRYRPELREAAYRQRMNRRELDAAFLRALPSVKGVLGLNYDSNEFLSHNQWASLSARISWNLLEVFRYPAKKRALQVESQVMDQRDLALTMAVLTQVHVARVRFLRLTQEINSISRAQAVQERMLGLSRSGFKARAVSQQMLVREEMNSVLAEVRYDIAYADLQNAYANLYASMGLDNFDIDFGADLPLKTMTAQLEQHWSERAFSLPPMPEGKP